MKKFFTAFYIFLFVLATCAMIVCIYGIFTEKALIYFAIGTICYVVQNMIICLIYNEKDTNKKEKKK